MTGPVGGPSHVAQVANEICAGLVITTPSEEFSVNLSEALTSWAFGPRMRLLPAEVADLARHIETCLIHSGWPLDEIQSGEALVLRASDLYDLAETAVHGVLSFGSEGN